jgi:hypothetical protein
MLDPALSQLAWAHWKAVEAAPADASVGGARALASMPFVRDLGPREARRSRQSPATFEQLS